MFPNRVALIGFSGAGKSTIGKKLALALHLTFVDLDFLFETKYHIAIPEFFVKYGEAAFRKCEQDLLIHVLQQDDVLIATGGGTPCYENSMQLLLDNALVVYIRLSNLSLHNRLIHSKKTRPLTANKTEDDLMNYIEETMKQRSPFYERAHLVVKGENMDINNLVGLISDYHLE